jgi:hypothetical protein
MSRPTFRGKAGLIFALAAFVLGLTAATALGWQNEEKGHGKGKNNQAPPTVTTPTPSRPPVVVPTPAPAPTVTPAAPAPPVTKPAKAPSQVKAFGKKKSRQKTRQGGARNVPAKAGRPSQTVALAPAVERKELARTGLSPLLIALMGALSLAGGALLFRRALVR